MRNVVDRYANGIFDYDSGKLIFSVPKIEESIPVGQMYEGTFVLSSDDNEEFSANVYTSDMRLILRNSVLKGYNEVVHYVFDSTGLEAGEVIKGEIKVASSNGEYYLPFSFSITYGLVHGSIGNVRNLFHFANQAQTNWDEAVELFYSPAFADVFGGNDRIHYNKYRGFLNLEGDSQSVDDFIVSVNKKRNIEYTVDRKLFEYTDVFENVECAFMIRKNTWGNVQVSVTSDAPFIQIHKEELTADDFEDNACSCGYTILDEMLHEGKNFGRITVKSIYTEIDIMVIARHRARNNAKRIERRDKKKLSYKLMRRYIDFRMKKLDVSSWVRESMKIVEKMNSMDEKNPVSRLFQVQLLSVQGRNNDAGWILEHVENEMNISQCSAECYAYFLYLKTLISRDEEFIDETTRRIQELFTENPNSFEILWILLYLDENLARNSARKIGMIEKLFSQGCISPVLYIEAYNYYVANPDKLMKLNDFEMQILTFALKQGVYNSELMRQFIYVASKAKNFTKPLFKLLKMAYELSDDSEIVDVICSLLIKNNISGSRYFEWFDYAVKLQLRITKLYEYYMYSIPYDYEGVIPKAVLMYFGYRNDMNYHKIAFMYANLIKHKRENADSYEAYREHIQVFAVEQVSQGHIDGNLAVIYEDALLPEMIRPEMAQHLARILFANEVRIDNPLVKKLVLYQEQFEGELVFPVENGFAYPTIYSNNYTLFAEDAFGRRSIIKPDDIRKLMNEVVYIPAIRYYITDNVYFAMYLCEGKKSYVTIDATNVEYCRTLAESEKVSEFYKRDIRMALLRFYYDNDQIGMLDDFLEHMNIKVLSAKDRADVINYMVLRGMYEMAYNIIAVYGVENVPAKVCVKICSHMIEKNDKIPDLLLVKLCYHTFTNGKYDEVMLKYLVDNFNGLTKELRNVWKAACEFNVDCFHLLENLIIQMLYTHITVGEREEIFEQYSKYGSSPKVRLAYLSYSAYEYFAKERITSDFVFENIVDLYRIGEPLNDACKLALLKYYAEDSDNRSEMIKKMLKSFLVDFMHRNTYFKFFSAYNALVPEIADYMDKTIIEYRTNPKYKVTLHYIVDDPDSDDDVYHTEEMKNMYGGVFSREFILFFGENLQYYITEEQAGKEVFTASDTISISDTTDNRVESRYTMLNDMVVSKTVQDDSTLLELMKDYVEADAFAHKIFKIR